MLRQRSSLSDASFSPGMLLWSYFSVIFTDPGSVQPNYRPLVDQERGEIDPLEASEFGPLATPDPTNTRIRYCRKCNQLKPRLGATIVLFVGGVC